MAIRSIEIDDTTYKLVSIDGHRVVGDCDLCGACCLTQKPNCPHILRETIDGRNVVRCAIHGQNKPLYCVIWPRPETLPEDVPAECKLRLERMG